MNILILAAGYATRLYPLTLTRAKPLLEVAGKPMIEWVLDNLAGVPDIEKIYVVTNNKFAADFQGWADEYARKHGHLTLKIVNDGSTSDSDKLGAIGDINLAISRELLITSDLLIVAGDNLFSESLDGFVEYARQYPAVLATYDVKDLEAIKKYNNLTVGAEGTVTHFEEKPAKPANTITGLALYYFAADTVQMFSTYLAAGNNPDQPGHFIQWLYPLLPVHTYEIHGTWYDIGSKETLEEANRVFAQFVPRSPGA